MATAISGAAWRFEEASALLFGVDNLESILACVLLSTSEYGELSMPPLLLSLDAMSSLKLLKVLSWLAVSVACPELDTTKGMEFVGAITYWLIIDSDDRAELD